MIENRGKKSKKLAFFAAAAGIAAFVIAAVIAVSKGNARSQADSIDKALRDVSDMREDIREIAERLSASPNSRSTCGKKDNPDTDAGSPFCPIISNHVF